MAIEKQVATDIISVKNEEYDFEFDKAHPVEEPERN